MLSGIFRQLAFLVNRIWWRKSLLRKVHVDGLKSKLHRW